MFILKKGHQPGVYVPLRALFLVIFIFYNSGTYKLWAEMVMGRNGHGWKWLWAMTSDHSM